MAAENNMGRMFLCFLLIACICNAAARYCLNQECSDVITSARIKTPFKTKHVHLYPGDEVDILSKSDDGSHMEFEIGDVKGIIPTENLKESSLRIDPERLTHIPEFEEGEDDDADPDFDMMSEDSDDPEGFNPGTEELLDGDFPEEREKVKKPKKKLAKLTKKGKAKVLPDHKDARVEKWKKMKDELKNAVEEDVVKTPANKTDLSENSKSKEIGSNGNLIGEASASGNQGNDKVDDAGKKPAGSLTADSSEKVNPQMTRKLEPIPAIASQASPDFKAEIRQLANYKIMKERYVKGYLDTNYAGKKVDESTLKQVEDFIEGDMFEQLNEPESELLDMLLNYDSTDLPGGTDEEGPKEEKEVDEGEKSSKAASKDGIIKANENDKPEEEKRDVVATEGTQLDEAKENVAKEQDASPHTSEGVDVALSSEKTPENGVKSQDPKPESEKPVVADVLKTENTAENAKQDYTQHPNFNALKRKYVDNYLQTQYGSNEVSPHILMMVENLISSDLVQQLSSSDGHMRQELLRLNQDKEDQDTVKQDTTEKDEIQTNFSHDTDSSVLATVSSSPQVDDVKFSTVVDNVVHSNAASNVDSEATSNAKVEGEKSKDITEQVDVEDTTQSGIKVERESVPDASSSLKLESEDSGIDEQNAGQDADATQRLLDVGSGPIPPAGGKGTQKKAEEEGPEQSDQIEKEANSEAKHQEIPENGKENEKTKEEEENTNNFSFRKLGNVLKDRFKAFANKMITKEQEDALKEPGSVEKEVRETSGDSSDSEQNAAESTPKESRTVSNESSDIEGKEPPSLEEDQKASLEALIREGSKHLKEEISEQGDNQETGTIKESIDEPMEDGESMESNAAISKEGIADLIEDEKNKEKGQINEEKVDLVRLATSVPLSAAEDDVAKLPGDTAVEENSSNLDFLSSLLEADVAESTSDESTAAQNSKSDPQNDEKEIRDVTNAPDHYESVSQDEKLNPSSLNEEAQQESSKESSSTLPSVAADEVPLEQSGGVGTNEESLADEVERKSRLERAVLTPQEDARGKDVESGKTDGPDSGEKPEEIQSVEVQNNSHGSDGEIIATEGETQSSKESDDPDANVHVASDNENVEKPSPDSYENHQMSQDSRQIYKDDAKEMEPTDEYSRDALLEMCHGQPSLPECAQLRGTKIYRGSSRKEEQPELTDTLENVGRLNRAWRNLMKIMKRIKLMKLGFVRVFHGPLSVIGLEDMSHWVHGVVEHASPEVITIIVCCFLLIAALALKSCFITKHVKLGASAYDVHKMRQSKQRILQENTDDMASHIRRLEEILKSKDSEINSGGQVSKDLEGRLHSLQAEFDRQENQSDEPQSRYIPSLRKKFANKNQHKSSLSSSASSSGAMSRRGPSIMLDDIRRELQEGKNQQKKLHEMIGEKEEEINEADDMALRHQSEIERQKEISEALNSRLEKVVDELDLKDGVVLELQEKNGTLVVKVENVEKEKRQLENERSEITERCQGLKEELKLKEDENGRLQDEIDEKENEIEVLRECMAQINNGSLDGAAVEDFETPEEDPDIKEQLKTERLKQILESTQALANLKKSEKEKEFFQEGYLEELEKREQAEEQVKSLKVEVGKLSKDVITFKTSSNEYHIKLETLQQYFKQQETELHRKLSVEEQSRLEFQKKYEATIGQTNYAVEETSSVKSQNEDLRNEIKEMERSIKEMKSAAEKESHDLWIKNRQANRDLEEMKRERDVYRKRLLEAETAKKRAASPQLTSAEKSRGSPAGSDDGRPQSPGSQKSGASGVPNFMMSRPMFPPPPPPMFPNMRMPMGPMPSQPGPFGQMPPMMGRPQIPMSGPPGTSAALPPSSFGQTGGMQSGPSNVLPTGPLPRPLSGMPMGPPGQFGSMAQQSQFNAPATSDGYSNPIMAPNRMSAPLPSQNTSQNEQATGQQIANTSSNQQSQLARRDSQKSLNSNTGRQQSQRTPNMQRRFPPQSSSIQGPLQSTPINSPNMTQTSQLPPSHPSLMAAQQNPFGRPHLQRRANGSDVA